MKTLLLTSVAALAMVAGLASANAADLGRAPITKAPAYVPPPVYSWTGFYVGLNGGWGWGRSHFNGGFPGSFDIDGGLVGGTAGYNFQTGPAVFGIEGDIDWADIGGSGTCTGLNCSTHNTWLGTVRGRLGYAAGTWMPYVTGGLAVGDIRSHIATFGTNNTTKAGWTVGAGIEAQVWGPVTAKIEYLYVDLGRGDDLPGLAGSSSFKTNVVRAGLNYRF